MKLIDKITLALKNIRKEGSKSILTAFITFILFSLLTSIIVIGTSFYSSINNTYDQLLDDNKLQITCPITQKLSNETYEKIKSLYNDCEYTSQVKVHCGLITLYDYDYLQMEDIDLEFAKNKNYVFLNSSYKEEYSIDDTFKSNYGDLIVKGFFSNIDEKAIADIDYFQYNVEDIFSNLIIVWDLSGATDFNMAISNVIESRNNFENIFQTVISTGFEDIEQISNTSKTVLILIIFMSFFLLILSIGTISNSIIISMDQNYYLTGLYKSIGMTDKDTFSVVLIQTIITIVSTSIISSLLILCMKPLFAGLTNVLFDFVTGMAIDANIIMLTFDFSFPVYVPIIMMILFISFSLFFARTSIGKIVKATPIEIINEVNNNEK